MHAGDYDQREEKDAVAAVKRRGPEQECASSEKNKARDETRLVSRAAHEERGGHGQQEISQVKSGLHQAGLKARDGKRLHEMADQDVVEIVRNAPEKKQDGDKNERNEMSGRKQSRSRAVVRLEGGVPLLCEQRHRFFGFRIHLSGSRVQVGVQPAYGLLGAELPPEFARHPYRIAMLKLHGSANC